MIAFISIVLGLNVFSLPGWAEVILAVINIIGVILLQEATQEGALQDLDETRAAIEAANELSVRAIETTSNEAMFAIVSQTPRSAHFTLLQTAHENLELDDDVWVRFSFFTILYPSLYDDGQNPCLKLTVRCGDFTPPERDLCVGLGQGVVGAVWSDTMLWDADPQNRDFLYRIDVDAFDSDDELKTTMKMSDAQLTSANALRTIVAVPVYAEDEPVGVLRVDSPFSPDRLGLGEDILELQTNYDIRSTAENLGHQVAEHEAKGGMPYLRLEQPQSNA